MTYWILLTKNSHPPNSLWVCLKVGDPKIANDENISQPVDGMEYLFFSLITITMLIMLIFSDKPLLWVLVFRKTHLRTALAEWQTANSLGAKAEIIPRDSNLFINTKISSRFLQYYFLFPWLGDLLCFQGFGLAALFCKLTCHVGIALPADMFC